MIKRGVESIFPSKDLLSEYMSSGRRMRIYAGIDPTAPSLHLGHISILLKLKDFQEAGHRIIFLIGDFTAAIGDPTGKKAARVTLSPDEVNNNLKSYLNQAGKILDLSKTEIRRNSEWYDKMLLGEMINIMTEFTVGQMIERDMFKERIEKGNPIYLHEFIYPILQGYDSVALDVDMEIGGNDQTFNMLSGRDMRKKRGKEKIVMALKLLIDPSGRKMGKTERNMIFFTDEPSNMYGKIMSWPDSLLSLAFEILTREPLSEVANLITQSPLEAKKHLARRITILIHGETAAARAQENFGQKFVAKEIADDISTASCAPGTLIVDVLMNTELVPSRSQWRRLVKERAVEEVGGALVQDSLAQVDHSMTLRIGKTRFLRIECV